MSETEPPSDEEEFRRALGELIRAARTNDVDVRGGWRIDGADGTTDMGVEIYRLAPRED
jgi:hypothetical protein